MEQNIMISLRNLLSFGVLIASLTLATQPASLPFDPLQRIWHGLRLLRRSIMERIVSKSRVSFQEIDMTKFEP